MADKNIFSALAKYASANEENYLTEAFVFLINSLLEKEPAVALEILTKLCVENNEFPFDTDETISVSTQETTEQGTPDIKVSSPSKLIYVEVKDYSPVEPKQLKRYKKDLESRSIAIKRLVLLTRFPVDFSEHQGIPDKLPRWFEVYNWLASAKDKAQDPISIYLIKSFMSFLEVKRMSIEKVGWEYINGVPALNNLINMIEAAIKASSLTISKRYGSGYDRGFSIENGKFWCGVVYDDHRTVIFGITRKQAFNMDLLKNRTYDVDENNYGIWFRLGLENIHFFSLDKDKQLEEITKFVQECHAQAQKMKIPEK